MKLQVLALLIPIGFTNAYAQHDTLAINLKRQKRNIQMFNAPILLMGVGMLATSDIDFLGKEEIFEGRSEHFRTFKTTTDDFLQYAPIAGVLALNTLGVRGRHSFNEQMMLLAKAELIMATIVFPLKSFTSVPRPDGCGLNSFPSGHTAQAFVAATFLHMEYGREHPWYSVIAFGTASAVGALRVMNNRHWSSDVLFGAGVGILSTRLAYILHEKGWGKRNRTIPIPYYANGSIGVQAIIPIKSKR